MEDEMNEARSTSVRKRTYQLQSQNGMKGGNYCHDLGVEYIKMGQNKEGGR
jgi:hypothetical protein